MYVTCLLFIRTFFLFFSTYSCHMFRHLINCHSYKNVERLFLFRYMCALFGGGGFFYWGAGGNYGATVTKMGV